jgi:predicted dehydrogenase
MYEAGAIGTVREIHYWTNRPIWPQGIERPLEAFNVPPWLDWDLWLGPAPFRPYAPAYAPFRWRGWWDFGTGALGDIAVHSMDAAHWILGLGYPSRVEPETSRAFTESAPRTSRLAMEFPARGDRPALRVIWRDGDLQPPRPAGLAMHHNWPYGDVGSQLWIGDDGAMLSDAYGNNIVLLDAERRAHFEANPPEQRYPRVRNVYTEWFDAIRAGTPAGSDFVTSAGPLTDMILLANLAVRMQQTLDIDTQRGVVTNVTVPEDYVGVEYRRGWEL